MPRAVATSVENNFTKGLITEVTGVNSPENSVSSSLDVIYDRKGRASSRPAFGFEEGSVLQGVASDGVRQEFLWETVADNTGVSFVVVQFGSSVRFFLASSGASLSSGIKSYSVNLLTFKVAGFTDVTVQNTRATFTSGKGYLFIAHPNCETIYVKYDSVTDTITPAAIGINIRDFEGVPDDRGVTDRFSTDTAVHRYNLYNQGWYTSAKISGGVVSNVTNYWFTQLGTYPSNADFWWYYTVPDTAGATTGEDNFTPSTQAGRTGLLGNTPAPKGHYIINALQTNRSTLSGIPGVPEASSNGYRASVVAFFAGRAFFGGVGKSGFSSTIYFSQIVEADDQLGKCYQSNDPTSKDYFDLLANDGGTIKIQDINTVIDMRVVGQNLYVFASNGVWAITGSNDGPFKATDYTVSKISSFPAISRTSIVDVGGLPVWWNYEGIFTLQKTQVGLTTEVTNLSQSTIQTFYDAIPQGSKLLAKGSYNDQAGIVYFLYNSITPSLSYYDSILALDVVTGSFYPLSVPVGANLISGLVAVRSSGSIFVSDNVTLIDTSLVTTTALSPVTINLNTGFGSKSKVFKFLTIQGSNATFSELVSGTVLDYGTLGYAPFFITGYRIRGDLLKLFQTNYLTVITEDIEGYVGSCFHQNLWDYSNSSDTGKSTNPQQVYRSKSFRDYQRSRLKTRGRGTSLQFKFFGQSGRPFIIVGWAGFETVNQVP